MKSLTYKNKLYNKLNILFLWKSTSISILKKIEVLLHINGSVGYDLKNKKWVIGRFNDILDDNGDYVEYVCHTLSTTDKECYVLKNHSEVIVCGNNSLYKSDTELINWFSEMLEETDISIYFQLINSRNIPMVSVATDKARDAIENAFNKRKAGQPVVPVTGLLDDVKTLDIVDDSSIDKLSTLDNFHEELIKRICNEFGIDIETKEKKAQVSEMELDSFGDYSTLNYLIMEIARQDFCDEMNANGIDIEFVRNPVFWDEPTDGPEGSDTDVETGEFELMEGETDDKNILQSEEKDSSEEDREDTSQQ